ncbi:MAG: UDP-N-acetylglucosamine--N-acetylmuramyl-(pentapeptide) pyrophosphoryl-undecaprenol N-acetylglucosamine transferase, partial [Verrucomicrobia bacterium]|nr:UDP-N-acetylglucosamine--N-acetylmuramyl-(pentapeptide) pyrophosphoryl-undecaprenol N-acetylglucosamine transferase [Verrucomicrobiota bacterium]
ALQNRNYLSFARHFWQSWRAARKAFAAHPPDAVLAMGGFTAAPPVLAAKRFGAQTFLHESNTIPGRANRFLARRVDAAFTGFPEAAHRLRARDILVVGTPVRPQFLPTPLPQIPASIYRTSLGLDPARPVVLVTGGSQGASGLNELIIAALPALADRAPHWQWLHLTGVNDAERVRAAYAAHGFKAVVQPFCAEIELAFHAATAVVSRAGASSLAEIAAMKLPALLVPLPTAADNHQFHNARALVATGAARMLEQKDAPPEKTAALLRELMESASARTEMQDALAKWRTPRAAEKIAETILKAVAARREREAAAAAPADCGCDCGHTHQ